MRNVLEGNSFWSLSRRERSPRGVTCESGRPWTRLHLTCSFSTSLMLFAWLMRTTMRPMRAFVSCRFHRATVRYVLRAEAAHTPGHGQPFP